MAGRNSRGCRLGRLRRLAALRARTLIGCCCLLCTSSPSVMICGMLSSPRKSSRTTTWKSMADQAERRGRRGRRRESEREGTVPLWRGARREEEVRDDEREGGARSGYDGGATTLLLTRRTTQRAVGWMTAAKTDTSHALKQSKLKSRCNEQRCIGKERNTLDGQVQGKGSPPFEEAQRRASSGEEQQERGLRVRRSLLSVSHLRIIRVCVVTGNLESG